MRKRERLLKNLIGKIKKKNVINAPETQNYMQLKSRVSPKDREPSVDVRTFLQGREEVRWRTRSFLDAMIV